MPTSLHGSVDTQLTMAGAVMGTPAYMAPEQYGGEPTDARTDQFSFCVTLWEALYGERPYQGKTFPELSFAVLNGRRSEPARPHGPRWLRRTLERGLAVKPEERFPTLRELTDAIDHGRARTRRLRVAGLVGAVALAGGGVLGWRSLDHAQRVAACEAEGTRIEATWNEGARDAIAAGIRSTEASFAEDTIDRITPRLDDFAERWRLAATQACSEHAVERRWDASTRARAGWCLDEARVALESAIETLTQPEPAVASEAISAVGALPSPERCVDARALALALDPPTGDREALLDVRRMLARSLAAEQAGHLEEAIDLARAGVEAATKRGWKPLMARARTRHGNALYAAGRQPEGVAAFEEAYFEASESGAPAVAADAAYELADAVGRVDGDAAGGRRWARLADIALAQAGAADGMRHLDVEQVRGHIAATAGEHEEARALLERVIAARRAEVGSEHPALAGDVGALALAHYEAGNYRRALDLEQEQLALVASIYGPDHPRVAIVLNNLGNAHKHLSQRDEALKAYTRALDIRARALGKAHPHYASSLVNLAAYHGELGELDRAKALLEEALPIQEAALGKDHIDVAATVGNLAITYDMQGDVAKAKALYERALAIREHKLGPDHPLVATALYDLSWAYRAEQDFDEAVELLERCVDIRERKLGHDHVEVGAAYTSLGYVHRSRQDPEAAAAAFARARVIYERTLGPEHPNTADILLGEAEVAQQRERYADALELAERGLAIREKQEVAPHLRAASQLLVADLLWVVPAEEGRDRARARELAEAALANLADAEGQEGARQQVETWLAAHD